MKQIDTMLLILILCKQYTENLPENYKKTRALEEFLDKKLVPSVTLSYQIQDKQENSDGYWKVPFAVHNVLFQRFAHLQSDGELLPTSGPLQILVLKFLSLQF